MDKVVDLRQPHPARPEVPAPGDETISLHDVLNVLRRRQRVLLAVALGILVATAIQVFTMTPRYRASTLLQIDPDTSQVLPYQPMSDQGLSYLGNQEYLRTVVANIEMRSMAVRVADRLDLANRTDLPKAPGKGLLLEWTLGLVGKVKALLPSSTKGDPSSGKVDELLANLEVQWIKDTRLVEVAYISPSAPFAAEVANAFSEEFIEQHDEQQFESVTKVADFLGTQLQGMKVKVEESEQALLDYARENDIVRSDQLESIDVKKLADLTDELTQVESELTQKAAQYQAVLSATPDNFPPSLSTKTIDTLRDRLANLKGDRAEFASQRGPNWPGLVALEEEIRQIESTLEAEQQAALKEARSEYQLALDRHNRLRSAVASQRTVVDEVSESSIRYNILKRDVETNQGLYEGLLMRLKEAGVATGLRSGNIFITDPAVPPRLPASPKRVLSLALALVVGLGLGVVAALVVEGLDDSVKTLEDITQRLSLPALGSVPSMTVDEEAPRSRWWRVRKADAEAPPHPLLASEAEGDLSLKAKEAYRMLRTSLLLSHSDRPPSVILVTSAVPRDGKTTTAANLAIALSQTGKRTVLVDLDLRKPDVARMFHVTERSGLSNYLSGNASLGEQLRETSYPQLQVVTAGPQAPNPTELIISQRMSTGLRYLRENFAYTIIDSPPALSVADALALSHLVDGTIVVARSGVTAKTALVSLVGRLRDAKAQLLGVVVNDVDYRRLGYGRSQYVYAYDYYVRPREGSDEVPETGS